MAYQVLALKYRPQTFEEIIGQSHVTRTLANAIEYNRVAHAVLLSGPRGTGKTTTARIFAKAVNCVQGPSPIPCNACTACREITAGNSSDVFEIDGASNNSVDQIRDLRENVAYMPSALRYKIYIIDEVHMLSTQAFNALLKTLEEPPAHVLFVFATTEFRKIPATILSRCQKHDLKRIPMDDLTGNIVSLCQKEGYTIDGPSAEVIAMESDGSVRDSLSLLDRVLAASPGGEIRYESVLENLGVVDRNITSGITDAVIRSDGAGVIRYIEKMNEGGVDLKKFYTDLTNHLRDLCVIRICGKETTAVNMPGHEKEAAAGIVSSTTANYLNQLLQILLKEESTVKYAFHTRTAVEMILLKLLQVGRGADVDEIISKLDLLAQRIETVNPEGSPAASNPREHGSDRSGQEVSENHQEPAKAPDSDAVSEPDRPDPAAPATNREPEEPREDTETSQTGMPLFYKKVEKEFPSIFAILKKGGLKNITSDYIIIDLKDFSPYAAGRIESKREDFEKMCCNFFNRKLKVKVENAAEPNGNKPSKGNGEATASAKRKNDAMNHPLVHETVRVFNGTIVDFE
ncbi:MAG: DNA polymerase III subunit gamma/tau [Desulfobacteraceae bacterium]